MAAQQREEPQGYQRVTTGIVETIKLIQQADTEIGKTVYLAPSFDDNFNKKQDIYIGFVKEFVKIAKNSAIDAEKLYKKALAEENDSILEQADELKEIASEAVKGATEVNVEISRGLKEDTIKSFKERITQLELDSIKYRPAKIDTDAIEDTPAKRIKPNQLIKTTNVWAIMDINKVKIEIDRLGGNKFMASNEMSSIFMNCITTEFSDEYMITDYGIIITSHSIGLPHFMLKKGGGWFINFKMVDSRTKLSVAKYHDLPELKEFDNMHFSIHPSPEGGYQSHFTFDIVGDNGDKLLEIGIGIENIEISKDENDELIIKIDGQDSSFRIINDIFNKPGNIKALSHILKKAQERGIKVDPLLDIKIHLKYLLKNLFIQLFKSFEQYLKYFFVKAGYKPDEFNISNIAEPKAKTQGRTGDISYQKYLKYKNKYLELKKKLELKNYKK
jgi:hypothetical protein